MGSEIEELGHALSVNEKDLGAATEVRKAENGDFVDAEKEQ